MEAKDGYFVFKSVAEASGADGSGYHTLKYITHTYGRTPEEYANFYREPGKLIFLKISDAIILDVKTHKVPERTEVDLIERVTDPITDLRWME